MDTKVVIFFWLLPYSEVYLQSKLSFSTANLWESTFSLSPTLFQIGQPNGLPYPTHTSHLLPPLPAKIFPSVSSFSQLCSFSSVVRYLSPGYLDQFRNSIGFFSPVVARIQRYMHFWFFARVHTSEGGPLFSVLKVRVCQELIGVYSSSKCILGFPDCITPLLCNLHSYIGSWSHGYQCYTLFSK